MAGAQDLMVDAGRSQPLAQQFRPLPRARANQHGAVLGDESSDLGYHAVKLGRLGWEDAVRPALAQWQTVGRHTDDRQLVDPEDLPPVLSDCAGHAAQLLVEVKEALVGDVGNL